MNLLAFVPFAYFQQTRLNNLKALAFHATYEWIPVIVFTVFQASPQRTVVDLLFYYLAFISVYEIGYLFNDQRAVFDGGRIRIGKLSNCVVVIFVLIRVMIFVGITYLLVMYTSPLWWAWYGLLVIQFTLHNLIRLPSLKLITFSFLAFVRFLSPVIFLLPLEVTHIIILPVFLNYVLFRLFIYIDSKEMLTNFDRKSDTFLKGYYLLIFPFSFLLCILFQSYLPVFINIYYLLLIMMSRSNA
ncbi:MAG TPA: hypothetical protein PKN99_00770, partial [Cyclobacteriaceae bacterium]|nr:hypothetical protein [Cyclobacteriaceae bacterium]